MSAFRFVADMHDPALKPRMLRSLLRDSVPDEKRPFQNSCDLGRVVSMIETYGLLSETVTESMEPKAMADWKSAVDSWVERVLALASDDMPDKCWAGVSLLGVTCKYCSSTRFLDSYSVWFDKLLSNIQPPAASQFVKIASFSSMSDFLIRLSLFPKAKTKKDGYSFAEKLIQPILKLLNEDCLDNVWVGAVHLLCTILTFFPSSVHFHYDNVEMSIASKILSGKFNISTSKKLACCLALLPKAKADGDTWSLMIRKILHLLNSRINDAFWGLEEEGEGDKVIKLLVPPGEAPPPPLGGHKFSGEAKEKVTWKRQQLPISSFSTLTLCCSMMLTNSYPVQVKVPIQPLLAFIQRVLMVNGAVPNPISPIVTAIQQEFVCSELPSLHSSSLDLLIAVLNGIRSQLLPYTGSIMRLVKVLLGRCLLPELRIKVYLIARMMLISRGVGGAMIIGKDIIKNASADLKPICEQSKYSISSTPLEARTGALLQSCGGKRKHSTPNESVEDQRNIDGSNFEVPRDNMMTSLMIAALEALEAHLNVGDAFSSERSKYYESWRSNEKSKHSDSWNVDRLLITVAKNSFELGSGSGERKSYLSNEPASMWADLKVAAFRALLACFLSSSRVRSPYLAEGLELFQRGKQELGTKLAQFCAHALLTLEVLIHPRALPLLVCDNCSSLIGAEQNRQEYRQSTGRQHGARFSGGVDKLGPSDSYDSDNEVIDDWLKSFSETVAPTTDTMNNMDNSPVPPETLRAPCVENPSETFMTETMNNMDNSSVPSETLRSAGVENPSVTLMTETMNKMGNSPVASSGTQVIESEQRPSSTVSDLMTRDDQDEAMVDTQQCQEPSTQFQKPTSSESVAVPDSHGVSSIPDESRRFASESSTPGQIMASGEDASAIRSGGVAAVDGHTTSNIEQNKEQKSKLYFDVSEDQFPDLVDAPPDSDPEQETEDEMY